MHKQYFEKLGFQPSDDECIDTCKNNPIINPQYVRYLGMGYYQILAVTHEDADLFLLISVGGCNGFEHDYNTKILNSLTINDSLSFDQLKQLLSEQSWCETDTKIALDDGEINIVNECSPGNI